MSVLMERLAIPPMFSVIPAKDGIHRPAARRSIGAEGGTHNGVRS